MTNFKQYQLDDLQTESEQEDDDLGGDFDTAIGGGSDAALLNSAEILELNEFLTET